MSREKRRSRRIGVVATLMVIAAGAAAATLALSTASEAAEAVATEPVAVPVELTTLTSELRLPGAAISFGEASELPPQEGMLTAAPMVGALHRRGDALFEIDGAPITLMTGQRPFWRQLAVGSRGPDVRQLEENLIALGFLDRPGAGDRFDWRTREAVRRWQRDLGVEVTGTFCPTSVVVSSDDEIRIEQVTSRLGSRGESPALVSETRLRATVSLTQAQARELVPGTPVTVVASDGTEVDAVISEITTRDGAADDGSAGSQTARIDFPSEAHGLGPGTATVIVRDPVEREATLVVPVTALLATADGGYAVEVWEPGDGPGHFRRVSVTVGVVADARAQILGGDLRAGELVVLAR